VLEFFFPDTITDASAIWFGKSRQDMILKYSKTIMNFIE
jgi:hypothetical protein